MSDPRFARFKSDPRFRRVHKKESKVVVDERFKSVFEESKKSSKKGKGRVDKYGRKISATHEQDDLRRFYRVGDEQDEQDGEPSTAVPDLARGAVLLESSDEEEAGDLEDDESDVEGVITLGGTVSKPIHVLGDEEPEIDLDEDNLADLDAQAAEYAKTHEDEEDAPDANQTRRLAVVNLDWEHVRAIHLYKIFSSIVSPTASTLPSAPTSSAKPDGANRGASSRVVRGKVLSVRVYPSQFGKERLAREETEGPPPELFTKTADDEDERLVLHQTADGEDYNEDALRKYQLERLRYYYAIVECDSAQTALHLYNELEGTELERSANVFDLSFVPDDMSFEDEFRDEATEDVNAPFKPLEFVTDALRHSKVKLTWDEDDPQRNQVTRRMLSRKEIEESDFKAYLASSTESESEGEGSVSKRKVEKDKLRALLLSGGDDTLPEGWGKGSDGAASDVDMEITFTPGLSETKPTGDETTLEKYKRKMKEKKKAKGEKKEKPAAKGTKTAVPTDDFFANGSDEEDADEEENVEPINKGKKSKGKAPRDISLEAEPRVRATTEELALLAASDNPNGEPKHFDMKAVLKAEKAKGRKRKGKRGKKDGEEATELQEDFAIDVKDDRFKAVLEDHTYAIDPSNPHFKKTKSMSAILEERSKRQRGNHGKETSTSLASSVTTDSRANLKSLVESVKRKSSAVDNKGMGKRRKL